MSVCDMNDPKQCSSHGVCSLATEDSLLSSITNLFSSSSSEPTEAPPKLYCKCDKNYSGTHCEIDDLVS